MTFTQLAVVGLLGLLGPLLAYPRGWHLPVVLGELLAGVALGRTGLGYLDAHDVTFTDGTPFDAEAVKANIEHLQDPDTGSSTGYLAVQKVEQVEAVDATHARFHLSAPDSALLESLSQQCTAMQSPTGIARGTDENCAAPVGTGPFVVEDWVRQQQVELVRNEDYVARDPQGAVVGG